MKRKLTIIISAFLLLFSLITLYIYQELFTLASQLLLIASLIVFLIGYIQKNIYIELIGYMLALITTLFVREKVETGITDGKYIKDWLSIMFTNKIVFINIIGNFLLYMPFYLLLSKIIKNEAVLIIVSIILIITGECLQYLFSLGVLDVSDIVINTLGVLTVAVINGVIKWMIKSLKKT